MRLAIDPGHGMSNRYPGKYDPGAPCEGYEEASIALDWALTLKHIASERGIECFLTRKDAKESVPISIRARRAHDAKCTHFISLHCNASEKPAANGTETFYRDSADKRLAAVAQKAALKALGLRDRGLKDESASQHARLAVFGFQGPACLVELGFITNRKDRGRMLERERRIAFAEALLDGLERL